MTDIQTAPDETVPDALPQFADLNLDPRVLQALTESGYVTPTPIQAAAIPDLRLETIELADGRKDRQLIAAPGERLWARFYDLQTNRPVYMGRDSVPHERLEDIEFERRNGYHYVGTWPETLLTRDYPRWKAGLAR